MNKIGLILASWNDIKYLSSCLQTWINWREHNPLIIAVLDVCFQENGRGDSTDGSVQLLRQLKHNNKIDFFEILPPGLREHEARNVALKYLLDQGCEIIISIGSDEIFKLSEITQIFNYVNKEEFIAVFKIHYKNYVGDENHYVLGFKPNRIWRVNYNNYKLSEFFFDDDVKFSGPKGEITDKQLPVKVIPNVLIDHFTWLDNERSKSKILYQEKHFAPPVGFGCSYKWENGKVVINTEFYKKTGQTIPEIYSVN